MSKSKYSLTSHLSTDSGSPLTYEKLKEAFDYLQSDEYQEAEYERARRNAYWDVWLTNAYGHNLITMDEYYWILSHKENGYVWMSKTWFDKIDVIDNKLKSLVTDKQLRSLLWGETAHPESDHS